MLITGALFTWQLPYLRRAGFTEKLLCFSKYWPTALSSTSFASHRYMVQWPGTRILRRQELDAFLAQALSPKLYEPDQLQELKVPSDQPCFLILGSLALDLV